MIATAAKEEPTAMVRVLALDKAADGVVVTVAIAVVVDVGTIVQPWETAWLRHRPVS
jgi:hypothetical protein